jgi:hypothetical protein
MFNSPFGTVIKIAGHKGGIQWSEAAILTLQVVGYQARVAELADALDSLQQ